MYFRVAKDVVAGIAHVLCAPVADFAAFKCLLHALAARGIVGLTSLWLTFSVAPAGRSSSYAGCAALIYLESAEGDWVLAHNVQNAIFTLLGREIGFALSWFSNEFKIILAISTAAIVSNQIADAPKTAFA